MADIFFETHSTETERKPYIFHENSTGYGPHWHENIEILRFKSRCYVYCDKELLEVNPDEIVVISSGLVHSIPLGNALYDCFIADRTFCADNKLDTSGLDFKRIISDVRTVQLFDAVRDEICSAQGFNEAGIRAAMLSLMVHLCRNFSFERTDSARRGSGVKRAMGYVDSRLSKHITVEEIADFVSMSKYHFCREFRKETGYTVVGYINLMRCLEAKRLISEKGIAVCEAAAKCGFENMSYFSRTFKSITGHLPSYYKHVGK